MSGWQKRIKKLLIKFYIKLFENMFGDTDMQV